MRASAGGQRTAKVEERTTVNAMCVLAFLFPARNGEIIKKSRGSNGKRTADEEGDCKVKRAIMESRKWPIILDSPSHSHKHRHTT